MPEQPAHGTESVPWLPGSYVHGTFLSCRSHRCSGVLAHIHQHTGTGEIKQSMLMPLLASLAAQPQGYPEPFRWH